MDNPNPKWMITGVTPISGSLHIPNTLEDCFLCILPNLWGCNQTVVSISGCPQAPKIWLKDAMFGAPKQHLKTSQLHIVVTSWGPENLKSFAGAFEEKTLRVFTSQKTPGSEKNHLVKNPFGPMIFGEVLSRGPVRRCPFSPALRAWFDPALPAWSRQY